MKKQNHCLDDRVLITLLRQRNTNAFRFLYDQYSIALYGQLLGFIADRDLAAQILQHTFQTAFETIDGYDPTKQRLFTWLMQIARNYAIQHLRSTDAWPSEMNVSHSEGGLRCILRHLTADQRQVIELMYYQGCTQFQVTQILDISQEAFSMLFYTAMQQIKDHLSRIQSSPGFNPSKD